MIVRKTPKAIGSPCLKNIKHRSNQKSAFLFPLLSPGGGIFRLKERSSPNNQHSYTTHNQANSCKPSYTSTPVANRKPLFQKHKDRNRRDPEQVHHPNPSLSRPPFTQLYFASRVSYDITLIFNKTMLWTRKGTHNMPSPMNNQRPWEPGGSMTLPRSPPTTFERKVSNA